MSNAVRTRQIIVGMVATAILLSADRRRVEYYSRGPLMLRCVSSVANGVWALRRGVEQDILPRKRRLEALLEDLEAA